MSTAQVRLPQMSFEELEECFPLETAFNKLRDNARQYYAAKVS